MKADSGNNGAACSTGNDDWIYGNIMFDRDVFGDGDYGDYGVALMQGKIGFGVNNGTSGIVLCSSVTVSTGTWYHVAVTRASGGQMCMYIDGTQRGCANGPSGNIAYNEGRSTGYPASDPYLFIGAEKHDAGSSFPSYHGYIDEVRLSNSVRYSSSFTKPSAEFSADSNTVALWHFNEGSGTSAADAKGTTPATLLVGGSPSGPLWVAGAPF
jgi:hypothetical protein